MGLRCVLSALCAAVCCPVTSLFSQTYLTSTCFAEMRVPGENTTTKRNGSGPKRSTVPYRCAQVHMSSPGLSAFGKPCTVLSQELRSLLGCSETDKASILAYAVQQITAITAA